MLNVKLSNLIYMKLIKIYSKHFILTFILYLVLKWILKIYFNSIKNHFNFKSLNFVVKLLDGLTLYDRISLFIASLKSLSIKNYSDSYLILILNELTIKNKGYSSLSEEDKMSVISILISWAIIILIFSFFSWVFLFLPFRVLAGYLSLLFFGLDISRLADYLNETFLLYSTFLQDFVKSFTSHLKEIFNLSKKTDIPSIPAWSPESIERYNSLKRDMNSVNEILKDQGFFENNITEVKVGNDLWNEESEKEKDYSDLWYLLGFALILGGGFYMYKNGWLLSWDEIKSLFNGGKGDKGQGGNSDTSVNHPTPATPVIPANILIPSSNSDNNIFNGDGNSANRSPLHLEVFDQYFEDPDAKLNLLQVTRYTGINNPYQLFTPVEVTPSSSVNVNLIPSDNVNKLITNNLNLIIKNKNLLSGSYTAGISPFDGNFPLLSPHSPNSNFTLFNNIFNPSNNDITTYGVKTPITNISNTITTISE